MASNQSKLNTMITMLQKINTADIESFIFSRSTFINDVMYFDNYTKINDGKPLPWELEIITMCYIMGYLGRKNGQGGYSLSSKNGRNILNKLQKFIKDGQDDFPKEEIYKVFSKMLIQQNEFQKEFNNLIYRYSYIYNFRSTNIRGNEIDIPKYFIKKFGYSYQEHEKFIFLCHALLTLHNKTNFKEVMCSHLSYHKNIVSNISETITQINEYQSRELIKVNYDWVYVFKTINVFPVIYSEKGQYNLLLPHRLIYSLTDGFVNKFTRFKPIIRENLGYAIQDYLVSILKSSKYFDFVIPEQLIDNCPDVICCKDNYMICFESKLHVFKNADRSMNFTEVDEDYIEFLEQIEKSYSIAHKILEDESNISVNKEKTYFILCVMESSQVNIKDIIDSYAKVVGFFYDDRNRLEYLYNHLIIIDYNIVELFFLYDNCTFLEDLIAMKTNTQTRFDFFFKKSNNGKLLDQYVKQFDKKIESLRVEAEKLPYLSSC